MVISMKRLLCIISGMNSGGAETFLMKLYRKLDRSKYQMDFCVNIKEDGFYDEEIEKMGGRIFHIPSKSEDYKQFKQKLYELIKKENYFYVLRITSNSMGFMDLKIAKDAGAKVCAVRSSNSNDAEGIKAKIANFIGKLLYSNSIDVKIAPSDLAAIYTFGRKSYSSGKVDILHNALDLSVYKYCEDGRRKIRSEFDVSDETILLGHIGRFSRQKNHKFLLNILSRMVKINQNVKLLLVGEGELEEEIKYLVSKHCLNEHVIFSGIRDDVPDIFSAIDVLVFPSFYEGMPNTIIEAQAVGVPCVLSNSITKQANVSKRLQYIGLEESVEKWCEIIKKEYEHGRYSSKDQLIEAGYDIESAVQQFVKLIFGKD